MWAQEKYKHANINKCQKLGRARSLWFAFKVRCSAWASDQVRSTVKHENRVLCCQSTAANCRWQGCSGEEGGERKLQVFILLLIFKLTYHSLSIRGTVLGKSIILCQLHWRRQSLYPAESLLAHRRHIGVSWSSFGKSNLSASCSLRSCVIH